MLTWRTLDVAYVPYAYLFTMLLECKKFYLIVYSEEQTLLFLNTQYANVPKA